MAGLNSAGQERIRKLLEDAVVKCSERCLYQSAKWAAELLNSMPESDLTSPTDTEIDSPMSDGHTWPPSTPTGVLSRNDDPREARFEAAESHKYLMAKTYFDCREYDRCAAVLLPMTLPRGELNPKDLQKPKDSAKGKAKASEPKLTPVESMRSGFPHLSQKALFLALYAKYMAGEKRKDEESELILGPKDNGSLINRELIDVTEALESRLQFQERDSINGQGWLEYLYGIVLAKGKNDAKARYWLTQSVRKYSFNWGAWQELGSLIGNVEEREEVLPNLPRDIVSFIFYVYINQQLFNGTDEVLERLEEVKAVFPGSSFLQSQEALIFHHNRDNEEAIRLFSNIYARDPLRLEDTDTYSNILYVMEKRAKLAYLAQLTTAVDKFRPETCVVVGNYHAKKSEHEKAVTLFRRALHLDRNFTSAWTLMGHEYVELKNSQTAIECYRRAVDVNRRDYRAWYGLGQTYEILDMHFYALFYYKRAASIAPHDPTMWSAVGSCLNRLNRPLEAIKAYKRLLMVSSVSIEGTPAASFASGGPIATPRLLDPDTLLAIAQLYERQGEIEEAEAYMELVLDQEIGPVVDDDPSFGMSFAGRSGRMQMQGCGVTETTSKARLWLTRWFKEKNTDESLKRAQVLATELCEDGYEVEEAKSLIKEIRAVISDGKESPAGRARRFRKSPGA